MTDERIEHDILEHLFDGVYLVDRKRRIRYWNPAAERLSGFSALEVVGRRCADNVLCHVDETGRSLCRGRCPLVQTMADGRPREARVFLHHKQGHRAPVDVRTSAVRDRSGRIVGAVEVFTDGGQGLAQARRLQELERMAHVDALTEVGNRRMLALELEARLDDLRRFDWSFGVLMADLDRFKAINDLHGHAVGDEVLKMVAKTLALGVRERDAVARYGGEEFVVLAMNSDREALAVQGERLRALLAASAVRHEERSIEVTASFGGAVARPDDTVESLLDRADAALYRSKREGRNRVTIEPAEPELRAVS